MLPAPLSPPSPAVPVGWSPTKLDKEAAIFAMRREAGVYVRVAPALPQWRGR